MSRHWVKTGVLAFSVAGLLLASFLTLPGLAVSAYTLGRQAYAKQNYHQALRYFQKSADQHPQNAKVYFRLGLTYARLKQYQQAKEAFVKVGELAPGTTLAEKASKNAGLMTRGQVSTSDNAHVVTKAYRSNRSSGGDNYLNHIIQNGKVVRWDTAKMPLKLYIHPPGNISNWSGKHKQSVYTAMRTWTQASGGRVSFQEVHDAKQADIRVVWKPYLGQNRIGVSPLKYTDDKILQADVVLTTYLPNGRTPLGDAQILNTAIHELGHALGLQGHSPHTSDIMYFSTNPTQTTRLSERDKKTFSMLYSMQPDITNRGSTSVADTRRAQKALASGHASFRAGDYNKALRWAESGLKLDPGNADLYVLKGAAYQNQGNRTAAIAAYKKALRYNPNQSDAKKNLQALGG